MAIPATSMPGPVETPAASFEPIPFAMLDDPLAYMHADHQRVRHACALLRRFAEKGRAGRAEVDRLIAFLERDLHLHHEDEEHDFFPLLRRRAMPEDELGVVLVRLGDDHRQWRPAIDAIVAALAAPGAGDAVRFNAATRELMLACAVNLQRHLAVENAIVFAIAAIRLTRNDMRLLGRAMKARRGVSQ